MYRVTLHVHRAKNPSFLEDVTHPALIDLYKIGCTFATDLHSTVTLSHSLVFVDIPTNISENKLDELIQQAEKTFYTAQNSFKQQNTGHVSLSIWHDVSSDAPQAEPQHSIEYLSHPA